MKRSTLILTGLLMALAAVAYLVMLRPGEQSVETVAGAPIAAIDSARVDRIDIQSPSSHIVLERQGGEWRVTSPVNARADQATVASFVGQINGLRSLTLISSKPEKHTVFQVDSTGTEVSLYQGQQLAAAFVVGKASSSFTETFVRTQGSNDVVSVNGALGVMFLRPLRDWRDKTIFSIPRAEVRSITYQYGDTIFTVAYRDSLWVIGDRTLNASAVDGLLASLSNIQCDDFAETAPQGKPMAMLTVGSTQIRFVFDKATNRYAVQTSGSPQWTILEPWKANQVLKRKKDLL